MIHNRQSFIPDLSGFPQERTPLANIGNFATPPKFASPPKPVRLKNKGISASARRAEEAAILRFDLDEAPQSAIPFSPKKQRSERYKFKKPLTPVKGKKQRDTQSAPKKESDFSYGDRENLDSFPEALSMPTQLQFGGHERVQAIRDPAAVQEQLENECLLQTVLYLNENCRLTYVDSRDRQIEFERNMKPMGSGDYSNAYEIAPRQKRLVKGVSNDELVLKFYHNKRKDLTGSRIRYYMKNQLEQYCALRAINFPVARLYNRTTTFVNGFFLFRKITGVFENTWNNVSQHSWDVRTQNRLNQTKVMYTTMIQSQIPLDMVLRNLKIDADASGAEKVVLIDLREEREFVDVATQQAVQSFSTYLLNEGNEDEAPVYAVNQDVIRFFQT